jgi:outer membrane receptor protein involved in Fe transport
MALIMSFSANAQKGTVVSGKVNLAKSREGISAVSVTIKNTSVGTFTNDKGEFSFTTTQKPPFTLVFSSIGYASKEASYTGQDVTVEMTTAETLGQEVVVAASRVQERLLESPVSIERMGTAAIRNAAAPNYYDGLANFKGVDMTVSSTNFRTVSTRGFNGSGNLRFNQIVDGMDNQAPGLNFSVGSIVGPNQLDVENVELLQGASSALYGSGGMTGTLLMNSKNPFKYQGLSFQIKGGINHIDNKQRASTAFHNWDIRFAKKVNDKWAYKIGAEMTTAQDWQANDMTNLARNNVFSSPIGGTRASDQGYDGVNVYGDEVAINMQATAMSTRLQVLGIPASAATGGLSGQQILGALNGLVAGGATVGTLLANPLVGQLLANPTFQQAFPFLLATLPAANNPYKNAYLGNGTGTLSRTGYNERDLVDYNNYNIKLNGALHYKISNSIEASISANFGQGTTVYTGSDRYSVKNLRIGQYKAEIKGSNWFLRAYTTQENSGDAYTATTAAVAINRAWKSDGDWFRQYLGTYSAAYFGLSPALPTSARGNAQVSDAVARGIADAERYQPGSVDFNRAFNNAVNTNISQGGKNTGGAKFNDQTSLYHYEGQYRFTQVKAVDIMVGASYRSFNLSSNGTIFADDNGSIKIDEVGGYVQLQKKFLEDKLKVALSGRYDKNSNFDGRFTPRATVTYEVKKNNFIRFSFQQAYRFPTTQDQWINLRTPGSILIGGMPYFKDAYKLNSTNPLQYVYTAASVGEFRNTLMQGAPNPNVLKVATFNALKPEVSNSFELGYRGLVTKDLMIDAYVYYSQFNDFITREAVARSAGYDTATQMSSVINHLLDPSKTDNLSFVTNSKDVVKAIGWGISAEYKFYQNFMLNANVSSDRLDAASENLFTQYNTPNMRMNIGVSNANIYKNIGFGAVYRWQDKVKWQGTFGSGEIPSFGTVDAFLSYKVDCMKSLIKVGAQNLYNKYYRSGFGNPQVGGLYYISFGYNVF